MGRDRFTLSFTVPNIHFTSIKFPKRVTRDELNALVDRAADLVRTAVDYKFILVLLFLKRHRHYLNALLGFVIMV